MQCSSKIWMMLCFCSAAFLFASCSHNDKKQSASKTDSLVQSPQLQSPNLPAETELQQAFHSAGLRHWQKKMKKNYPDFSSGHFHISHQNHLPKQKSQKFSTEKWQVFEPYFIKGPKKELAIDLYSYSHLPSESGNKLEAGSPDSQVNLVHLADKTKTKLLFAGPGTEFQQAEWLSDSIVIITGESDANAQNKKKPMVWEMNIFSGTVTEYSYRDSVLAQ